MIVLDGLTSNVDMRGDIPQKGNIGLVLGPVYHRIVPETSLISIRIIPDVKNYHLIGIVKDVTRCVPKEMERREEMITKLNYLQILMMNFMRKMVMDSVVISAEDGHFNHAK